MPSIRKQARQIARNAVEKQKDVAKNLKSHDDPRAKAAGKAALKKARDKQRQIKENYIATRKEIKEQLKKK